MSDQPAPSADRSRRWLGPALLASLAVNLFLVGLVAAPLLFGRHGHERMMLGLGGPMPPVGMMHRSVHALPPEDREVMREAMAERFQAMAPHLREMEEARQALAGAIDKEPYDEAAMRAAFDRLGAAMAAMAEASQEAMIEGIGKLSAEQRGRLAEQLREPPRFMRRFHRKREPAEPGEPPPPLP